MVQQSRFGTLYTTSLVLRAVGRTSNPTYREFLDILEQAQRDFQTANKARLAKYDFEFKSWPVEFKSQTAPPLDFVPHPGTTYNYFKPNDDVLFHGHNFHNTFVISRARKY